MKIEVMPRAISRGELGVWIWVRIAKGASFCQVAKMTPVFIVKPWRTSGCQEWRGASPILRAKARVTRVRGSGWFVC